MKSWHNIKGYLSGVIALVVCPCHLPITFPLILSLTAGTALGSWLAGKFSLVFGISTALFVIGLFLTWWWIADQEQGKQCSTPQRSKD